MRTALTIAGSDSSGGAGIQADLKTMIANGVYAMTAITALTAQNTTGVQGIFEVTPEFLEQQIDSVFTDIRPDAVKIGMVSSVGLIRKVRITVLSDSTDKVRQTEPDSEMPETSETADPDKAQDFSGSQKKLAVGQSIRRRKLKYRITSLRASGGTLCLYGLTVKKKTLKTVAIPDTIRIGKRRFRVTRIAPKTFQNCKNLRKIRLGKYIRSIGRHAFHNISRKAVIRSSGYRQSRLLQKHP